MDSDRKGLFGLAALAILILAGISFGALSSRIPSDSQTLLGTIAGGLLVFAKDIVTTIRAAWTDARTTALTDHLAKAAPAGEPQEVKVTNEPSDPIPVEDKQ